MSGDSTSQRDAENERAAAAPVCTAREAIEEEFERLGLRGTDRPTALCLSGGGIRSAAFCLGVIQALARYRLLTRFHYLSTVSGGGYIGAWLTRLIAQRGERASAGLPLDMSALQDEIAAPAERPEEDAVRGLRRYTSYLTPNRGFASLDTWAGLTLWLRNTLINWSVFLPVFGALAGLPILYVAATYALAEASLSGTSAAAHHAAYLGALALFIAALGSIVYLPSHAHPDRGDGRREAYGLTGSEVFARIVLPIVFWCLLAAASAAPHAKGPGWAAEGQRIFTRAPSTTGPACPAKAPEPACPTKPAEKAGEQASHTAFDLRAPERHLPLVSFLTCLAAYLGAFVWTVWKYRGDGDLLDLHTAPFAKGVVPWVVSSLVSSLFLLVGIRLVQERDLLWLALAGPLWVALAETLRTTLYVALRRSGLRSDSDREWLARLNGSKLRIVLGGSVAGTVIVLGGTYLAAQSGTIWTALIGGGAASGSVVALLGSSARTSFLSQVARIGGSATEERDGVANKLALPSTIVLNGAIVLFGAVLFALVGRGLALLVGDAAARIEGREPDFVALAWTSVGLTVALAVLALILGWAINLNRFSMHAVYRNRLIRAFLGSGRTWADRRPDRFTQFDPRDNIRMADTFTGRPGPFLFPVVNVALNRTSGRDTARAERKAEPFTITPLRCGAATLPSPIAQPVDAAGNPIPDPKGGPPILDCPGETSPRRGAYAPTRGYAVGERDTGAQDKEQGITLGTAITISGAAASPNMGYHSSPLTAFIMTLFNVRLGAWLPNPAMRRSKRAERQALLRASGPRNEVPTLILELIGRSDIDGDFLYLSDGGHFDNLGVYEMLRRRCRLIVAVDAGQDKDYAYEDLARLKQNARIDLGVEIDFLRPIVVKQTALAPLGALATIRYPKTDGQAEAPTGHLLYLKSWLPSDSPVELAAYRTRKLDFPHESTGNQFFTESDFESYRHLGNYLARSLIEQGMPGLKAEIDPGPDALDTLFAALDRAARRTAPARARRPDPARPPVPPHP